MFQEFISYCEEQQKMENTPKHHAAIVPAKQNRQYEKVGLRH
jgi:hypothetical protein